MIQLQKEQLRLLKIGCGAVQLLAWFALPLIKLDAGELGAFLSKAMPTLTGIKIFTDGNPTFFQSLLILILLLAPIYYLLTLFKDNQQLEGLKKYLIQPEQAALISLCAAVVFAIWVFAQDYMALGFGLWIYLLAAIAIVLAPRFVEVKE